MNIKNTDFWTSASQARDALEEQLSNRDDIRFVDIGYAQDSHTAVEVSLRIHVCDGAAADHTASFPNEVDGVPVVVSK